MRMDCYCCGTPIQLKSETKQYVDENGHTRDWDDFEPVTMLANGIVNGGDEYGFEFSIEHYEEQVFLCDECVGLIKGIFTRVDKNVVKALQQALYRAIRRMFGGWYTREIEHLNSGALAHLTRLQKYSDGLEDAAANYYHGEIHRILRRRIHEQRVNMRGWDD